MLHEVSFASYNGRDQVQGWIYVPACKPKGIVQVIHGFGEHSRRYLHLIAIHLVFQAVALPKSLFLSGLFQSEPEPMKVKPSFSLVHSHITLYHCTFRVRLWECNEVLH